MQGARRGPQARSCCQRCEPLRGAAREHDRVGDTRGSRAPNDYLALAYQNFRATYPEVANPLDQLGQAADVAGPLDERPRRLVHLGIAIGALAEGAVRSNVRKALDAGVSVDEIRQVSLLAITTSGFPNAIAGLR
jgi:4-carboxymuconolactone decarboxylase